MILSLVIQESTKPRFVSAMVESHENIDGTDSDKRGASPQIFRSLVALVEGAE